MPKTTTDTSSADILVYDIENSRYINLTGSCTLKCRFCPKNMTQPIVHDYDLSLSKNYPASAYIKLLEHPEHYDEVVFCGFGEPTIRLKELLEIAEFVKAHNGHTRINTDGLANLVHKKNVLPQMKGLIDAISVSMNAQDETTYIRHCDPGLEGSYESMLDFLRQAPEFIPSVTATAIKGLEGVDISACEKLAKQLGVKFRCRFLDRVG